MENKHSKLDALFRDKISDYEYSAKKGNWGLLKHTLNALRTTKRIQKFRIFLSSLSLIVILVGSFWFSHMHKEKSNRNDKVTSNKVPIQSHSGDNLFDGKNLDDRDKEPNGNNKLNGESTVYNHRIPEHNTLSKVNRIPSSNSEKTTMTLADGDSLEILQSSTRDLEKHQVKSDSLESDPYAGLSTVVFGNDVAKIEITNLGKEINSSYSDFAPVITADGSVMFFTSRRPVTPKEIRKGVQSKEHIYSSFYNSKRNKWSEASLISSAINAEGRNNSAIGLSNDGQRIFLYRDDNNGNGDIYESTLEGAEWTEPVRLDETINTKYHESSACISPDGKTLYFISDRPGGMGGRDIWSCTKDAKGKWGKAKNIGEPLNTEYDEEGVFIHPDGKTIYFSSKGHSSMGGYDIYRAELRNGTWSAPANLGAPLNTSEDDLFFVMEANGTTAYYVSSKPGGIGERDIYKVNFHWIPKEGGDLTPNLVLLKGVISDDNGKPFEASIEIVDNEKNEVITKVTSNGVTGKYLVSLPAGKNYGIHISSEDYLFHSENFNIPESSEYEEVNKNIVLQKIEVGKSIVLKNIFYDFDRATLRNESISELKRLTTLMKEHPSMKIELSSHTDNKGNDDYNLRLSQHRAQSVVEYLIKEGISKDRLTAKGYGESEPIAPNENSDGSDNPEGRQSNRRTEFKILTR
jgi:outer membrane protein OmpA-like peptidoglycan-associated protein